MATPAPCAYGTRIADGDSVAPPKPAPDLFLFAAKQIGIEPDRCVVVEDADRSASAQLLASRSMLTPSNIGLPAKLWEWSVSDVMKAISAAQDAAKSFIYKAIYRHTQDELERARLFNLLHNDPTNAPWLHRVFRQQYQGVARGWGSTFVLAE